MSNWYDESKKEEWIKRFEDQKERIQKELFDGETMQQCLNTKSFNGRFYNPMWVITSEARIWSLAKNKNHGDWLSPKRSNQGKRNADGGYTATRRWYEKNNWEETVRRFNKPEMVQVYYHQIVANYFCDKTAIDIFGEDNCVSHHIFGYKRLFDNGMVQDKQTDCTWNNRAKHLRWTLKKDHTVLSYIQDPKNARQTLDEVIEGIMRKLEIDKADDREEQEKQLKWQLQEIVQMGKFYTDLEDQNGRHILMENFSALWYDYAKENNAIVDPEMMSIKRSLKVKSFTNPLPYMK